MIHYLADMKSIAYQGVEGAYSHITAVREFGEDSLFLGVPTFKEVFELVSNGKADRALVPIENSLIGSIYEIYDLLGAYGLKIIGEHVTQIEHCLLVNPVPYENVAERLRSVTHVFSHPKALEQCAHFFETHPWMEKVVHEDTAGAAKEIALRGIFVAEPLPAQAPARSMDLKSFRKTLKTIPKTTPALSPSQTIKPKVTCGINARFSSN